MKPHFDKYTIYFDMYDISDVYILSWDVYVNDK